MKIIIDDCLEVIDNALSEKQRKKRKKVITKWINKDVIPSLKSGKVFVGHIPYKEKVCR